MHVGFAWASRLTTATVCVVLIGGAGPVARATSIPPGAASQRAAYSGPRTAWGAPSLEGMWTNASDTPLERPMGVAALELDDDALPAYQRQRAVASAPAPGPTEVGQNTSEWWEHVGLARIGGRSRTSWITDPVSGRLPYSAAGLIALRARQASVFGPSEGPEARTASDRCLQASWSAAGPPMLNSPYAPNYVIAQTADTVAIFTELLHEVRTVRLNTRGATNGPPVWMGESVGRWEGATLVVETRNFRPDEGFRTPTLLISPQAKITERFTRLSPTEIRYTFTVDDPALFTQPWSGEMPFRATKGPIYEYACAEGNYSMAGILAGARRKEAEAKLQYGVRARADCSR